ncbi:Carnitine dehydratase [Frankia sp. AiPs1]|uniref:CoA transferase n=1 Tax=Frankia sp. AiPa1 TaxID=573492 RepID=UPI00202AE546|nr:CoA transferase [Frankia sp. AiPa1]MCL9761613.1 CoA transferase [Frankia sp. AiPa1]
MTRPGAGLRVVEVAVGTSELGLGLAGGLPGMIFADLGAEVVRVVGSTSPGIDAEVPWGQAWHRDKRIVVADDPGAVLALLDAADVAVVHGDEELVEARGLGYLDVCRRNPRLVYARCRPSRTGSGVVADYGLLVEARAGFCSQLAGHRPGPILVDARAAGIGTAFLLVTSALALLRRRAETEAETSAETRTETGGRVQTAPGTGGWAETSLYDGMLATLGCMIGRSERAAPAIEGYWEKGSTFPNFLYRCADGELIQIWFGGKGMYQRLIDALGDEPSTEGYYQDQVTGRLGARARRWQAPFALLPRDVWIARLRQAGVACEPVLGPGDALSDPHLADNGLVTTRSRDGHQDILLTTPIAVEPLAPDPATSGGRGRGAPRRGLLGDIRVLDFSAFVAGPLAAQVLADLGADVIKVEPPEGEAMRAAAYAVAACQRGKRSLAIDIGAAAARPVVERLIRWADVVLHNFRVGVAERLRIDAATVARLNPSAVYCHASAFGPRGPRARQPGNDALMQALTGLERAVGGAGNQPIAPTWIPLDVTGGWVAAAGILAGLYARARTGRGQRVDTSLLGAGLLVQSGVFLRDGDCVRGPTLDGAQTGYGPGYRLYQGGDGGWFALVLADEAAWSRLRALPGAEGLPAAYAPLRGGAHDAQARQAETVLEQLFATASAAHWAARLRAAGLLVEPVDPLDRDAFRRRTLDDPVNRQLGRVVAYQVADWGHFEQIGPLARYGPAADGGPALMLPGIGEHSVEVLAELGLPVADIDDLLATKTVRQL